MELFFVVNIVFGMYRRRVRPATKNDVAQHGGHSPANTKSRFTAYIFDIGHPCYGQFTHPKSSYPLIRITCHIASSSLELVEVKCFFLS